MRKCTLLAFLFLLFFAGASLAEEEDHDHGKELRLGDKGFGHTPEAHDIYQRFFTSAKCSCTNGQCRPSSWARVEVSAKAPAGIVVLVDRKWCGVTEDILNKQYNIPGDVYADLAKLGYRAHVCATASPADGKTCPTVECVVFISDR